MASYLIKKNDTTNEIVYMEYELEGYDFTPKSKSEAYLKVDHVSIINPSMIEKLLALKFDKTFKKLASVVIKIIEEEGDSDSDVAIALDEISRMKSLLAKKYNKFLSKEKAQQFLLKLDYLERELRYKELAYNNNYAIAETKGIKR